MALPLLLSLAALLVGPLVYRGARYGAAAAAVDSFALVGVAGLVFAHILPQSFALAGWSVLPVALVGLVGPGLLCGSRLFAGRSSGRITMPLALAGIALHALLDGVALAAPSQEEAGTSLLALAVVLHRVPVGLGIWWLARPIYGLRAAASLLVAIALFTVLGFAFEGPLLSAFSGTWFALFQALVAGSLLHVVFKHPPTVARDRAGSPGAQRLASGIGGMLGLALILGLESWHLEAGATTTGAGATFVELLFASAPALLFAYVAVAVMHALRLDLRRLLGGGGTLSQTLRGTFAGLPIPICSCGVIPLYRSLVQQRVPAPAGMAFLVATPELGIAALFLSWRLLGAELTLTRALTAMALALAVGLLVGRRAGVAADVAEVTPDAEGPAPWRQRAGSGLRYGFGDMVDGTAPWILVGIALAAVFQPLIDAGALAQLSTWIEVPLFALIGVPLYVCASGSTPLAAVLIAKGVSPGAAIAFLLTGPATNVTTFGVLSRLHSRRVALAFAAAVTLTTVLLGWVIDATLTIDPAMIPFAHGHEEHGPLAWLSLGLLVALFLVSFLRQGTRGFVAQVISPHGVDSHAGHDHGDGDGDERDGSTCCAHDAPASVGA